MDFQAVHSGALTGAENMALDARLLDLACSRGTFFFRSYAWIRPTLSLGYFQKEADVAVAGACGAQGVDVVQRFTGGGAILHHQELTYSLAVPPGHPLTQLGVNESYLELTRPLLLWLRGFGLAVSFRGGDVAPVKTANCFAGVACPDLVLDGKKVFGSAQRRRQGGILQHGSLLLDVDDALWAAVFGPQQGQGYGGLRAAGLAEPLTPLGLLQAYQTAWRIPFQKAVL